ncbi:MAG: LamG domain-containing protein [bacterium]|nr:LamG domain-containing protein [bacterium]
MTSVLLLPVLLLALHAHALNFSLSFSGTGTGDIDRVKIPLDGAGNLLNIGNGNFTIEFWMKAFLSSNTGTVSPGANDNWITGNIIFDRDVYGNGDYGDFGISLGSGRIAFGVNNASSSRTILGTSQVANGQWHHIAVTRAFNGAMAIFVNGTQDAFYASGPAGNISYRTGRSTSWPNDPYLVIGAEKHDYDPSTYPSFSGWLDEVRISTNIRYTSTFQRPTEFFLHDQYTVGLFSFNEGSGTVVTNWAQVPNPTHGQRMVGGYPPRPAYSTDVPPLVPESTCLALVMLTAACVTRVRRSANSEIIPSHRRLLPAVLSASHTACRRLAAV